ncbi:hypothetical protein MHBO_002948 [Bonamia ostreae]|uniref:Uncharacterized protein n=1 Tax=Bonamia ostreae TaxID=126728 RepID=A0ABV2AP14_9EUKA
MENSLKQLNSDNNAKNLKILELKKQLKNFEEQKTLFAEKESLRFDKIMREIDLISKNNEKLAKEKELMEEALKNQIQHLLEENSRIRVNSEIRLEENKKLLLKSFQESLSFSNFLDR